MFNLNAVCTSFCFVLVCTINFAFTRVSSYQFSPCYPAFSSRTFHKPLFRISIDQLPRKNHHQDTRCKCYPLFHLRHLFFILLHQTIPAVLPLRSSQEWYTVLITDIPVPFSPLCQPVPLKSLFSDVLFYNTGFLLPDM